MDQQSQHPQPPDDINILTVFALTEGFVIKHQGKTLATATPGSTGKLLQKILAGILVERAKAPANAIAGVPRVPTPKPTPPEATPPMSDPTPVYNTVNARKNLANLVQRRVAGQLSDSQFWALCQEWCVPLTEADCMDAIDAAFETEPAPWVPDEDGVVPNPDRRDALDPQLVDLTPAQMVDNWIVDDSTGERLPDEVV